MWMIFLFIYKKWLGILSLTKSWEFFLKLLFLKFLLLEHFLSTRRMSFFSVPHADPGANKSIRQIHGSSDNFRAHWYHFVTGTVCSRTKWYQSFRANIMKTRDIIRCYSDGGWGGSLSDLRSNSCTRPWSRMVLSLSWRRWFDGSQLLLQGIRNIRYFHPRPVTALGYP